jgi:hypothetical protein
LQVASYLRFSDLAGFSQGSFGHSDGLISRIGGVPGFADSVSGGLQSLPNQQNASATQEDLNPRSDHHPKGPFRHILLGLEISLSAIGFFGGFFLILFGWGKLADNGIKRVFDRQKGGWIRVIGGLGLAYLGAVISTCSLVYWLLRDRVW